MKLFLKIFAFIVFLFILIKPVNIAAKTNINIKEIQLNEDSPLQAEKSTVDSIIDFAKTLLKKPYHRGSAGPNFFDCSGFTYYVFSQFGYELPRTSHDQSISFHRLKKNQIAQGDLVFFEGRRQTGEVGHVGIVVKVTDGIGDFDFIHAATKSGVIISNSKEPYYKRRYIKSVRVVEGEVGRNLDEKKEIIPSVRVTDYISPAKYHKVRSGETLSLIARRYNMTVDELKRKNNLSSSVIVPDQLLKIFEEEKKREIILLDNYSPNDLYRDTIFLKVIEKGDKPLEKSVVVGNTNTQKTNNAAQIAPQSQAEKIHKVQKSESLYMVSLRYGVSIDELEEYNNIKSAEVREGDLLKIPETKNAKAPNTISLPPFETNNRREETVRQNSADNNEKQKDSIKTSQHTMTKADTDERKQNAEKIDLFDTANTRHIVQSGETLFSISKQYNVDMEDIKKLNALDSDKILLKQVIIIPNQHKAKKDDAVTQTIKYKVDIGDSLYAIARKHDCTVSELLRWNNKKENDKLIIGEELIIYKK